MPHSSNISDLEESSRVHILFGCRRGQRAYLHLKVEGEKKRYILRGMNKQIFWCEAQINGLLQKFCPGAQNIWTTGWNGTGN